MFDEKGELDGNLFLREQKVILKKQKSFVRECKSSDFLHTETFGEISKPRQTTSFLHHIKPWFYSKFSTTHTNFHFHRTQYNVQFSFLSTACGGKPAQHFRFFAKPDSAVALHCRFAPVQSLKAVLVTNRFNFYKKCACVEL